MHGQTHNTFFHTGTDPYTVFAPTNEAFNNVADDKLEKLFDDKEELTGKQGKISGCFSSEIENLSLSLNKNTLVVRRSARESHFRGLIRQVDRSMFDGFRVGGSCSRNFVP